MTMPEIQWRPSPNHNSRDETPIDILLLHYTGMDSAEGACAWLCDPQSKVSAHYLVDETGVVTAMVEEERRAWHAGAAYWGGERDINARSIGIEIHNGGHPAGLPAFPDRQIASVATLAQDIVARNAIPATRVLAHSDVSPGRKVDPGEVFPWEVLANAGVGLLPKPDGARGDISLRQGMAGPSVASLQRELIRFGYGLSETGQFDERTVLIVSEVQRHYRRSRIDGIADGETRSIVEALVAAL